MALDDGSLAALRCPPGRRPASPEAVELRTGTPPGTWARASSKPSRRSWRSGPALIGYDAIEQRVIDQKLIDLDGTPDKGRIGANAILGVSLAVAKAAAESAELELFRYVGGPNAAHILPGADDETSSTAVRTPTAASTCRNASSPRSARPPSGRRCAGVPRCTTRSSPYLKKAGFSTALGDEGGFAPAAASARAALRT